MPSTNAPSQKYGGSSKVIKNSPMKDNDDSVSTKREGKGK